MLPNGSSSIKSELVSHWDHKHYVIPFVRTQKHVWRKIQVVFEARVLLISPWKVLSFFLRTNDVWESLFWSTSVVHLRAIQARPYKHTPYSKHRRGTSFCSNSCKWWITDPDNGSRQSRTCPVPTVRALPARPSECHHVLLTETWDWRNCLFSPVNWEETGLEATGENNTEVFQFVEWIPYQTPWPFYWMIYRKSEKIIRKYVVFLHCCIILSGKNICYSLIYLS